MANCNIFLMDRFMKPNRFGYIGSADLIWAQNWNFLWMFKKYNLAKGEKVNISWLEYKSIKDSAAAQSYQSFRGFNDEN